MAAQLSGIIAGLLGKPDTIQDKSNGKPVTVIFVGPTGVGKNHNAGKNSCKLPVEQKKDSWSDNC